jgi:hypothetical protein
LPQPRHSAACEKKFRIARQFFSWAWLTHTSGFRVISLAWIELLCTARQKRALVPEEHVLLPVEEAICLATLPGEDGDLARWRDRAAAARLFLTGERANALVTSPVDEINFADNWVRQLLELGVKNKNGKKATTFLLPVPELLEVVHSWDRFVRTRLPGSASWYAPVENTWGE